MGRGIVGSMAEIVAHRLLETETVTIRDGYARVVMPIGATKNPRRRRVWYSHIGACLSGISEVIRPSPKAIQVLAFQP